MRVARFVRRLFCARLVVRGFSCVCVGRRVSGMLVLRFTYPRRSSCLFCGGRDLQRFYFHAGDTAAIHFHHGEAMAFGLEAFAAARNETQVSQDETANGFVTGIIWQDDVVARGEIADFQGSVENHGAVGKRKRALDDIEFIVNFADHLLEDIFERCKAKDAAEFVDNHSQASATRAEFDEQIAGGFCFGDNEDIAQERPKVKLGWRQAFFRAASAVKQDPDEVFDVDEAEDVVERAFKDGNAGALGDADHRHGFLERSRDGEGVNIRPRNHDFAHLNLAELHRRLDEFDFAGADEAAFASLLNQHLELFNGANQGMAGRRGDTEETDKLRGDEIEGIDGPAKGVQEPFERASNDESNAFGTGQTERFGNQFTEDDFEASEKGEGDDQRDAMSGDRGPRTRDIRDERAEDVRERDFTDIAEEQADDGDSNLNSRDHTIEVSEKRFDDSRPGVALFDQLVDAGGTDSDERKFGRGEKGVDKDEEKDTSEVKDDHRVARLAPGAETASMDGEVKDYRGNGLRAAMAALTAADWPRGTVKLVQWPLAK